MKKLKEWTKNATQITVINSKTLLNMQESALKICSTGKYMLIPSSWSVYHQAFASQYYSCPLSWYQKCKIKCENEKWMIQRQE